MKRSPTVFWRVPQFREAAGRSRVLSARVPRAWVLHLRPLGGPLLAQRTYPFTLAVLRGHRGSWRCSSSLIISEAAGQEHDAPPSPQQASFRALYFSSAVPFTLKLHRSNPPQRQIRDEEAIIF